MAKKKTMPDVTKMTPAEEAVFWDNHSPLDFAETEDLDVRRVEYTGGGHRADNDNTDERVLFRASSSDLEELRRIADEKSLDLSTLIRLITRHYLQNKDDISLV